MSDYEIGPWRPVRRIRGFRYLIGNHDSDFAVILHLDAKPRWAPFWITVRRSL